MSENKIQGLLCEWEKPIKLGFRPDSLKEAVMLSNGIKDDLFLSPELEKDPLYEILQEKAESLFTGEFKKVFISSDYDVDGTTSTCIMASAFRSMGCEVHSFVPDRFIHAYGVNKDVIQAKIKEWKPDYILALDCGATELDWLEEISTENNIKCSVIDHHKRVTKNKTHKLTEVNPQNYLEKGIPETGYSTAMLAAMCVRLASQKHAIFKDIIPSCEILAGLSALADSISMRGIASRYYGRKILTQVGSPDSPKGLQVLAKKSGVESPSTSMDINFKIVPVLNACGRMSDAAAIVALLETASEEIAEAACAKMMMLNSKRQELQQRVQNEALERYVKGSKALVAWDKTWHAGVVGPAAGQLAELLGIPVFLGGYLEAKAAYSFSGRSGGNTDIHSMIAEASKGLPIHFGGHKVAMGMRVAEKDEKALFELQKNIDSTTIDFAPMQRKITRILSPTSVNQTNWESVKELEPFGVDNEAPVFCVPNISVKLYPIKGSKINASGTARDNESGFSFPVIVFRNEELVKLGSFSGHIVGEFLCSKFRGNEVLKFLIKDIVKT